MQFQVSGPKATPFFLLAPKNRLGYIAQPLLYIICCAIGLDYQDFNSKLIATFLRGDAKLKNDFCVC